MQAEQVDASASYDRIDWLIGVAALFHLRMNFLWLKGHTTDIMEQQDASILYRNINFWGRKNTPADRAGFQVLEVKEKVDSIPTRLPSPYFIDWVAEYLAYRAEVTE
jgi:hypothetical protein